MSASARTGSKGKVDGTQAIRRAAAIMRVIGQRVPDGADLAAITAAMDLSRSTTHRILQCLTDEGMIRYDRKSRRYFVGRLTYELGLGVSADALDVGRWRPAVDNVAARTGATTYLMGRSGIEATCLLKAEATTAIRVLPVDVGQRRYLGIGAGAMALLASLDPAETEEIIRTIAPHLERYSNLTEAGIRKLAEDTRRDGVAVSRGNVTENVIGLGVAIPRAGGAPSMALSVAALAARASDETLERWTSILREEIATASREESS